MPRRSVSPATFLGAAAVAGGVVYLALRKGSGTMSLRLVNVALAYLPTSSSTLGEGDPRWDALLGGKVGEGRWKYYQRGYGTTCGIVAAALLEEAGGPPELINRDPPGGSGFTPGAHISRLYEGAQKLGLLRKPDEGQVPDLRRGDIYGSTRPAKDKDGNPLSGEHVGCVVGLDAAADSLAIETVDGGQGTSEHQMMKRIVRRVRMSDGTLAYPDGSRIPAGTVAIQTPGVGNTKLAWWIRLEGEGS